MNCVHNLSVRQSISVRDKCIRPRGYALLSDEEMEHPGMARFLRSGMLEIVDYAEGMTPDQLLVQNLIYQDAAQQGHLLVQRTYAFGDVFLFASVAANLRQVIPGVTIHFGTSREAGVLLKYDPNMVLYDNKEAFMKCISTHGDFIDLNNVPEVYEETHRPNIELNRIEIMCGHMGIAAKSLCPEYYMLESEGEAGAKTVQNMSRPILGVAPISRRVEKNWPLRLWAALVQAWLNETGGSVCILHQNPIPSLINAGATTFHWFDLRMAAALAYQCDCLVTQDSLWTHLGAALALPQVLLTSCTDGPLLAKGYPNTWAVVPEVECYPCWYDFAKGGCSRGSHTNCMKMIEPSVVLETALEAWENTDGEKQG